MGLGFFHYIKEWSFEKLHQKKMLKHFPFLLEAEDKINIKPSFQEFHSSLIRKEGGENFPQF